MTSTSTEQQQRDTIPAVLPCPEPLAEAVHAGVFGYDEQGLIVPDAEDVRAMTEEHARELVITLSELDHLRRCAHYPIDPVSGKTPRSEEGRERLVNRLNNQAAQLEQHYEDVLAAYADGFGLEAADSLDRVVRENCDDASSELPLLQRNLF
jgi:hypothetical protein